MTAPNYAELVERLRDSRALHFMYAVTQEAADAISELVKSLDFARECLKTESKAREGREALLRENEALRAEIAGLRKDASRWEKLRTFLEVKRDMDGSWTCWLELACLPYRSRSDDIDVIVDGLFRINQSVPTDSAMQGEQPK